MRHSALNLLLAAASLWVAGPRCGAEPAAADFDPSGYFEEKKAEDAAKAPAAVESVKQNVVTIDGRPYYKFARGPAAIIVPKVDHLTRAEMERAVCAEDLKLVCDPGKALNPKAQELCRAQGVKDAIAARAELALTEQTILYADLIIKTIQTTCGGDGGQPNAIDLSRSLEIGVEWKNKNPRHPGSKKVFIKPTPLRPELGGGVSF
jgi:hypothetical protein